jgi:hypothetical protein
METEHYPNLVVGGGEAGKYLAWTLAKLGQRTVVIERALIGGSCPNVACLPSKNIIHSAKAVSLAGRAAVKVLHTELARDAEPVRRFLNEARAWQVGGSSPHLVPADERPFDGTAPHPSTTSPMPGCCRATLPAPCACCRLLARLGRSCGPRACQSAAGLLLMKLRTSTQKQSTRLNSGICSGAGRQ